MFLWTSKRERAQISAIYQAHPDAIRLFYSTSCLSFFLKKRKHFLICFFIFYKILTQTQTQNAYAHAHTHGRTACTLRSHVRITRACTYALPAISRTRWVNTKEEHCANIIKTIGEYCLCQRVKPFGTPVRLRLRVVVSVVAVSIRRRRCVAAGAGVVCVCFTTRATLLVFTSCICRTRRYFLCHTATRRTRNWGCLPQVSNSNMPPPPSRTPAHIVRTFARTDCYVTGHPVCHC